MQYEQTFAEEARRRQRIAGELKENFPEASETGQASDEAGELFSVSGRSVRDAKFVAEHDEERIDVSPDVDL
ncbi:hypothetical protein [Mycolicibacterium hippocampi]|uniref:hypothetical protein n=1 Tax=Mycobacteriaceae TaxID=1762 RepID=UPI0015B6C526|nr:hypothetical protein [Mycolicibacterium hippocampi]